MRLRALIESSALVVAPSASVRLHVSSIRLNCGGEGRSTPSPPPPFIRFLHPPPPFLPSLRHLIHVSLSPSNLFISTEEFKLRRCAS
jgi:hypothetical protein